MYHLPDMSRKVNPAQPHSGWASKISFVMPPGQEIAADGEDP
jgi:hypothetical protein